LTGDDDEWGTGAHIFDVHTGTVRICADLCTTCIYRPGNLMSLAPGRVKEMTDGALADEGHIVCHKTLGTPEPAICAGFEQHPQEPPLPRPAPRAGRGFQDQAHHTTHHLTRKVA
jgi:hypothetical protein